MSKLKQLASQTALYGISTILVRSLNWLITPFHTRVFNDHPNEFGIIVELYAYIAFINVVLMYGMETAFFRFASESKEKQNKVFSTTMLSLLISTSVFVISIIFFAQKIADLLLYPSIQPIIILIAFILGFDTLSNIPFAKLRLEGKPLKYILVKLLNVIITVSLNFLLLYPILEGKPDMFGFALNENNALYYVFLANLAGSTFTFIYFIPTFFKTKFEFSMNVWRSIIKYGLPLVIVGLAGIVNETMDRILLKYFLPQESLEERMVQVGIYGAAYKLAIFMSLVVQAYKMGAEPFFFNQAKDKDALETVAKAMSVFVIMGAFIFLGVSFNLDWIIQILGKNFTQAKNIVPIILMAYLFLGIFYNLSVWYKVGDKTHYATIISITGALVTIVINIILIPKFGYWASAWATFVSYFIMTVFSWQWGKKYYPVPYELNKIGFYLVLAISLYALSTLIKFDSHFLKLIFNNALLLLFVLISYYKDIKSLMAKT